MKFERLRLTGFKSFCDAADFKIEPGLTGVVGPNGCGKSNLVEALRWVMGESSFKNMRGSGMEDVIFAGSGRRPSRNIAEVGLVLDNSDRTRAGRLQRFRDDRGHPPHRARSGLDLSRQRPRGARARRAAPVRRRLDRRALARDGAPGPDRRDHRGQAAGAPAASSKRPPASPASIRAATRRSCGSRAPRTISLRVEDVLKQIDAQVDSLKRQARQSSRYRDLAATIRRHEALARLIAWREHEATLAEARRQLDADLLEVAERTRAQAEAARLQAIAAAALPPLREEEARRGAALHRIALAREALEGEEKRAKERAAELERRIAQIRRRPRARGSADRRRRGRHGTARRPRTPISANRPQAGARTRLRRANREDGAERRLASAEASSPRPRPPRPTSTPAAGRSSARVDEESASPRAARGGMRGRLNASARALSARPASRRLSARRALSRRRARRGA